MEWTDETHRYQPGGDRYTPTPTVVSVPLDVLADLWRYGNLTPVEGVIYGKTHRERLAEADECIRQAYHDLRNAPE